MAEGVIAGLNKIVDLIDSKVFGDSLCLVEKSCLGQVKAALVVDTIVLKALKLCRKDVLNVVNIVLKLGTRLALRLY